MRFDQIYRVTLYQLLLALIVGAGLIAVRGISVIDAAIWGGVTAIFPTGLHGVLVTWRRGKVGAGRALSLFYVGSVLKLLVTAAMFVIAVAVIKVEFVTLMSVYIAALAGYWVALVRVTPERRGFAVAGRSGR